MSGVDAHVHLWDPRTLDYPWLDGLAALDRPFLPDDYAGAGRVVFVQADCAASQALDEARWVAGLGWSALAGIVAGADLRSPGIDAHLDALAGIGPVVGIRHLLHGEPLSAFDDPALRRGLAVLSARGLTFDACVRHPQLGALEALLRAVPGVQVVLDHLGKPPVDEGIASEAGARWCAGIRSLASMPGLHVKLSGLPAESGDAAAYDANVDDFIRFGLDAFGPERSMLGSDWPVSALLGAEAGPEDWFARVRSASGLAGDEWERVASGTATTFYGLGG
jgi:L-fuconolactonase